MKRIRGELLSEGRVTTSPYRLLPGSVRIKLNGGSVKPSLREDPNRENDYDYD